MSSIESPGANMSVIKCRQAGCPNTFDTQSSIDPFTVLIVSGWKRYLTEKKVYWYCPDEEPPAPVWPPRS